MPVTKIRASAPGGRALETRTISCGRPSAAWNAGWNPACGTPVACSRTDPATGQPTAVGAFATLTKVGGKWTKPVVWCPADAQPAATMTAISQQALRLLPRVRIGSAWTSTALVHAQVILWAATSADRDLGTVTVVGTAVQLRVHLDHARWNFGDGTSDSTSSPGKPYDPVGDPCDTAQCPHYYGHTYQHTGVMTITLTLTWRAQFRIGTSDWTDLTAPLTGPTDRHQITVKQARGILVPNQ